MQFQTTWRTVMHSILPTPWEEVHILQVKQPRTLIICIWGMSHTPMTIQMVPPIGYIIKFVAAYQHDQLWDLVPGRCHRPFTQFPSVTKIMQRDTTKIKENYFNSTSSYRTSLNVWKVNWLLLTLTLHLVWSVWSNIALLTSTARWFCYFPTSSNMTNTLLMQHENQKILKSMWTMF